MRALFENNAATNYCDLIGETVTIYTQSGGRSGQGFTGVVLAANACMVRLVTSFGPAPDDIFGSNGGCCCGRRRSSRIGSVCDIPTEKIVALVRNAV